MDVVLCFLAIYLFNMSPVDTEAVICVCKISGLALLGFLE